jgi:S-formylglutathione hydrolase FrmB
MWSDTLQRTMPITVYLPPGYDSSPARRYPVHYLLHGLAGTNREWEDYGAFTAADAVFAAPSTTPFLIVLPQGDLSYWVDQSGGPRWGGYVARDVIAYIDSQYRTGATETARALGGLSAGADGALQISLSYPGVFTIVAAHSPVLRPYTIAAPFYGSSEYHAAHYPPAQFAAHVEAARRLHLWLDVGDRDEWRSNVDALHDELTRLGIPHAWNVWPGVHEPAYWSAHLPEYLRWIADQFALAR